MPKLRVYNLARELNLDNAEIIRELQHMGVPVTSHSNTVDDRQAQLLRKKFAALAAEEAAAKAAVTEVEEPKAGKDAKAPKAEPVQEPTATVSHAAPPVEVKAERKTEAKLEAPVVPPPAPAVVEQKPAPPPPPPPVIKGPMVNPSATVAPPPQVAPPVTPPAPPPPPPVQRSAPRGVQFVEPKQHVSPIVAMPPERKAAPAKVEPPHEERKTMQQIVQEKLRRENRLPPPPPARKPGDRPSVVRPPLTGQPQKPRTDFVNRGTMPQGPAVTRPGQRPPTGPVPPQSEHRRPAVMDRSQRYERHAERKLEVGPSVRPQPKVEAPREFRKVTLTEGLTVGDLATKLDVKSKDMIKKLMERGVFAAINQTLDKEMATEISKDFNAEAEFVTFEEGAMLDAVEISVPENLQPRAPVVTIMGHVDHGKTSLLDAIRKTKVTEQEHGGITQHIGAYQVTARNRKITFLDTPGHEAFTLMRARGARVTDIVVLVVAADDGVMPQTIESISHTRAGKVPLVVAINKVDKPGVNIERVKRELADQGLLAEDWGGDQVMVEVSARTGQNLDLLLEMILLVADIQALKADPSLPAMGTVLEAKIDRGRGNVATVLVQNGTLKVGDNFIAGAVYGKVRAMFNEHSASVKDAGPSAPVEVLGLQGLPLAGDTFQCIADDNKARQMAQFRQDKLRDITLAKTSRLTLDQLHKQLAEGDIKEVPLVLKCDVQGSQEALSEMLVKLSTDKVKVRILHSSVGRHHGDRRLLAAASNAIIIGFNVRPERKAAELANREKVDIRLHTIIYNVVDEIKGAMLGMLDPVIKETYLGTAEIRNTFRLPKAGMIAGCYVTEGKITRTAQVRLLRDNVVIFEGKIASLKRFKDDASEVTRGYECGIGIHNYNDIKVGDSIEAFVMESVKATAG
jgi:translation initiation factor IF-2